MSDAGLPGKPSEFSNPPVEDIPVALRETTGKAPRSRLKLPFWLWGLIGLALALVIGGVLSWQSNSTVDGTQAANPSSSAAAGIQSAIVTEQMDVPGSMLGHLPYQEAARDSLRPIVADGSIMLRQAAAEEFMAMVNAARAENVIIVPISGFRSIDDQERVFFGVKAQAGEDLQKRAEVSAPPGYSEHHTGYAIDIGDGNKPETELEQSFDTTTAFQWMQKNAAHYNFELSFPKDNPDRVSYEPWHWRFVGDRNSLETFYKARQLAGTEQEQTP